MIDENQRNHFVIEGTENENELFNDVMNYLYRKSRRRKTIIYKDDLYKWSNMYHVVEAFQYALERNKGRVYAWFLNGENSSCLKIDEFQVKSIPTNEYYYK